MVGGLPSLIIGDDSLGCTGSEDGDISALGSGVASGSGIDCTFSGEFPALLRICFLFLRRYPWSVSTMYDLLLGSAFLTVPVSVHSFPVVLKRTWSPTDIGGNDFAP